MGGRNWTVEETEYLIKNIKLNWLGKVRNYPELTEKLNRKLCGMQSKVQRLRATGDLPPIKTDEEFLECIKENALFAETNQILNIEELSMDMDICTAVLERKFAEWRRHGLLPNVDRSLQFDLYNRHYSEAEDNKIINLKKQDFSYEEIGRLLGRSGKSIKSRIDYLVKHGKLEIVYLWLDWEIEAIRNNVTFDKYGFVKNYSELIHLLQGRRNYKAISLKIIELRKQDRITVKPMPGKVSVAAIKAHREFKDITFAPWKNRRRANQFAQNKKPTSGATEVSKNKIS